MRMIHDWLRGHDAKQYDSAFGVESDVAFIRRRDGSFIEDQVKNGASCTLLVKDTKICPQCFCKGDP